MCKVYFIVPDPNVGMLFNSEKNFWFPIDELSCEVFNKIAELNDLNHVCDYFCDKYGISESDFHKDTEEFLLFLKEKGFIDDSEHKALDMNSINIISGLDDVKKYPFNDMYISLSDDCNLNCIYCFNKVKRSIRKKTSEFNKLTSNQIKKIIKEFKDLNGRDVVFTGGEPTLNQDLVELCEYVYELDMKPHFISNGLLLGTVDLERLLKVVDEFGISLDSMDDDILKRLWGVNQEGLSGVLIHNLDMIEKICEKNSICVTIKIMPIVSRINTDKLSDLVLKLSNRYKKICFRWSLTKYDKIGNKVDQYLDISEEEYVDAVITTLKHLSFEEGKIVEYAYSYDNKLKPSHEVQLITCAPSFFVANDGSVYPCQGCERDEMYMGNVSDSSLADLFETDVFKTIRNRIQKTSSKKCKKCELLLCCSTVDRPCRDWESEDCKEECIKRMFIDAIVN